MLAKQKRLAKRSASYSCIRGTPSECLLLAGGFSSLSSAEFPNSAASIYASLQLALSQSDKKLLQKLMFFSAVGITNSRFFLSRIRKFGRTVWIFYSQPNSCVPSVASDHRSSGKFGRTGEQTYPIFPPTIFQNRAFK